MRIRYIYLFISIARTLLFPFQPLLAQNPQDGWDFTYPGDDFSDEAMLDLAYLNEETAGENGFIRLSDHGESFINDAGAIRFWAINGGELIRGHDPNLTDRGLEEYARFLAKMGVNMIRYHGQIFPKGGSNIREPDRTEADNIWRIVAAMKEEGIYTTISPFWPAHMEEIPSSWNLGDYVGNKAPWGLLYFDEDFREAYKSWVSYLYTEVNPHTGIALKDDPAVALIQILNEDGVFFWTIGGVEPSLAQRIQRQFYTWTVEKYGNIEAAFDSWEQVGQDDDNLSQQSLGIINIWFATDDPNVPPASPGFSKRLNDQMQFFAEIQRRVYQELYDHYKALGCQQLINASNWRTAEEGRLLDLERWTHLPTEVMAVNRYYSPGHFGPNSGWRIERLHHYQGQSVMYNPHRLPINIKQVTGKPFLVTESGWNLPNQYQAEGPFLVAAYQSLTGVDGFYWFYPTATTYDDDPYWPYFGKINGELPMRRWTLSTPGQIGMFPANALTYRMGYIQQGAPVVNEARSFESLISRELPLITEEKSFDPNRDSYEPDTGSGDTELSPLTYLAGPVKVTYDGNPGEEFILPELNEHVDIANKQVRSVTGELFWDYEQGVCILDAPQAQGICGFPGEQDYELSDVIISSDNDYVVVNVVSMDGEPLKASSKILVQVGTVYRPTGWEETPTQFIPEEGAAPVEGFRIESLGDMPWKAANTEVTLTLKQIQVDKAWQLDAAGYVMEELAVESAGETSRISLPATAMYMVLETNATTTDLKKKLPDDISIVVYPNPGKGMFSLKVPQNMSFESLEVLSLSGQRLAIRDYQEDQTYQIPLSAGNYLIRLNMGDGESVARRILVE